MDITEAITQINWTDPWSIAVSTPIILHLLAKFYISITDTPDPTSTKGKVYKAIELIAGIAGKIKQQGTKPPSSRAQLAKAAKAAKDGQ